MRSESWPRTPAAKYLLLLLGLVPFGEIAYIAGPKALVPVAVGVVAALLTGLRILKRVERIISLEQSQSRREETPASAAERSDVARTP